MIARSHTIVAGSFLLVAAMVARAADLPPIVIDKGGTYSGNWASEDPAIPVIRIATTQPVIIEHSTLRGRGALINADNGGADLTVRDTCGIALNPNVPDRAAGRFVQAEDIAHLDVEHCELDGTTGIYVHRIVAAAGDERPPLRIISNSAKNIDGRRSDGHGGYRDFNRRIRLSDGYVEEGFDIVDFLQLNGVAGLKDGEIAWNYVVNEPGRSRVEDNISIYESSGVKDHPLLIHDNCIVGAYTIDPSHADDQHDGWREDWQYTGGGIMLGDGPAKSLDSASGFLSAYHNVVIATANYGIGVSCGHDTDITENRVISSGLANGRKVIAQNVGIYVWDIGKGRGRSPPTFFAIRGHGNFIGWTTATGRNDWWVPDVTDWRQNTHLPGVITPADEAREVEDWKARAAAAGLVAGVARLN